MVISMNAPFVLPILVLRKFNLRFSASLSSLQANKIHNIVDTSINRYLKIANKKYMKLIQGVIYRGSLEGRGNFFLAHLVGWAWCTRDDRPN